MPTGLIFITDTAMSHEGLWHYHGLYVRYLPLYGYGRPK